MTSICPSHELQPDSWWRRAVIYQIYIKSFADSNGDGFGDLRGATERLDYICKLGVDAVWLCPFYVSPNKDGGYDVSDHRNVDPMYGSLADAEEFIRSAHARDIRVIIDLVPNHSSDQHPFFQAALSTPPASFEWSRYHCVRGRGTAGELPPNNWQSFFGGSAWSPLPQDTPAATGWWYLHLFDKSQPDFNWQHADVVAEFEETMKFWLQRGVDGFRIDVAPGLVKATDYRDNVGDLHPARLLPLLKPLLPFVGEALPDHSMSHFDQPEVHGIYRKWRCFLDDFTSSAADGRRRIFVGEAWLDTPQQMSRYIRHDELHTGFNFGTLGADWCGVQWRSVINGSLASDGSVGAPTTWVTENHDLQRAATRYAVQQRLQGRAMATAEQLKLGRRRSLAAILAMCASSPQRAAHAQTVCSRPPRLALPGCIYVFNGQELGLEEVLDIDDEVRQDPAFKRQTLQQRQAVDVRLGRDGCRVPLPWKPAGVSMGFGPDGGSSPWLPQPQQWSSLSVAAQESRDDSMLAIVRRAVATRRSCLPLLAGEFSWLDEAGSSSPSSDDVTPAIFLPFVSIGRALSGAASSALRQLQRLIPPYADANVLAFERYHATAGRVVCVFNMSDSDVPLPQGQVITSSAPLQSGGERVLPGNSTAWVKVS